MRLLPLGVRTHGKPPEKYGREAILGKGPGFKSRRARYFTIYRNHYIAGCQIWQVGQEVGKILNARSIVDEKGRIILPKPLRGELGIVEGSQVTVQVEKERLVVSKVVEADDFIRDMEGFIKEGSRLPLVDPLSLKRIWEKA